jgi:hypothetical protein
MHCKLSSPSESDSLLNPASQLNQTQKPSFPRIVDCMLCEFTYSCAPCANHALGDVLASDWPKLVETAVP